MRRSIRLVLLAATAGLLLPVAASQTAVSAIDQDLVLSATSGTPGDEVDASSASCGSDDGETFQYLWARLLVGTAPNQVLAGSALRTDGDATPMIIPDWIDPAEPAVIQASCVTVTFTEDFDEPVISREAYDPVAFDVLAGIDPPVQERTYSRTSVLTGQAFDVQASGCFLDDADYAYVDVIPGSDLTFSDASTGGVSGDSDVTDGAFQALTAMTDTGVSIMVSGDSSGADDITIDERPNSLEPGTYSSIASCTGDDGATLMFEPQLIEVTGSSGTGDIDLTVPANTRDADLAGGSCSVGDADAMLVGEELIQEPDARARTAADIVRPSGIGIDPRAADPSFHATPPTGDRSGHRVLTGDPTDVIVTPGADGTWSIQEQAGFDRGLVLAFTTCGDPLADGFIYDTQAAEVDVAPVPPTTPTVPPTTPAPAPANAVPGTPTYAG